MDKTIPKKFWNDDLQYRLDMIVQSLHDSSANKPKLDHFLSGSLVNTSLRQAAVTVVEFFHLQYWVEKALKSKNLPDEHTYVLELMARKRLYRLGALHLNHGGPLSAGKKWERSSKLAAYFN